MTAPDRADRNASPPRKREKPRHRSAEKESRERSNDAGRAGSGRAEVSRAGSRAGSGQAEVSRAGSRAEVSRAGSGREAPNVGTPRVEATEAAGVGEGVTGSRPIGREARDSPWRRCAISRNRRPKEQLLRFVIDPGGRLVEDVSSSLPGRGIHVLPDRKRVTALMTRHKMGRDEVDVVLTRLAGALERRLLDGIGLARRTGGCRVGLRECEEWIRRGARPLILMAEDAVGLRERLEPLGAPHGGIEIVRVPGTERLGALWSGRTVVVIAVLHSGVGARIRADAARWWSFTRADAG
ncbi:hypothetical protein SIID45300_00067 [Candidatus Magnetaquicoccaceae bacterium FCR-1]|uniref:YlxR domain-containing protein n=1 Tax=Candidatus Magnetaquiglobus chichijimensis TaxID=3141448 RepID=A0ABQ0C4F4_9PROT